MNKLQNFNNIAYVGSKLACFISRGLLSAYSVTNKKYKDEKLKKILREILH